MHSRMLILWTAFDHWLQCLQKKLSPGSRPFDKVEAFRVPMYGYVQHGYRRMSQVMKGRFPLHSFIFLVNLRFPLFAS